jgi:hypothetical protein
MLWWLVALVAWVGIAAPVAVLVGAAARAAERREGRRRRPPAFVSQHRALAPLR